jgi:hypothetical protein
VEFVKQAIFVVVKKGYRGEKKFTKHIKKARSFCKEEKYFVFLQNSFILEFVLQNTT